MNLERTSYQNKNTPYDDLYDMVDVVLEMKGYKPGSIDSLSYAKIILVETSYAIGCLLKEGKDVIKKSDEFKKVGKRLRAKYIDRSTLLEYQFGKIGQELVSQMVLTNVELRDLSDRRCGYKRKIAGLLAMERLHHDRESLEPGFLEA